jgi:carboxyl-terminal processing protease
MRERTLLTLIMFMLVGALFLRVAQPPSVPEGAAAALEHSAFRETRRLLREHFVDEQFDLKDRKLLYGAISGFVSAVGDRYTGFLEPNRYKDLTADTKGQFEGLGVEITQAPTHGLYVVIVMRNSPAQKAGMRDGDRILTVDGKDSSQWRPEEAKERLRGPAGSAVRLKVQNIADEKTREITVTRGPVSTPSVYAAKLLRPPETPAAPLIGYVGLSHFQETSAAEVREALRDLTNQGAAGIILDLRRNPGGLLPAAVQIADIFLHSGVIVETRGRGRKETFSAEAAAADCTLPLALLVDKTSASASEVVAGALQDHGRAVLVGARTWGKFSVQVVHTLDVGGEKAALKITAARYYTPKGRCLDGSQNDEAPGLEPEHPVALTAHEQQALSAEFHVLHLVAFSGHPREKIIALLRDAGNVLPPDEDDLEADEEREEISPPAKQTEAQDSQPPPPTVEPYLDRQLRKALDVLQPMIEKGSF